MQAATGSLWRELLTVVVPGLVAFLGAMLGVELRATTSERGRILARGADLELILAEIKAQKEVETKVGGREWERQWRLQKKIDCYSLLLARLESLKEHNKNLRDARQASPHGSPENSVRSAMQQALIDFQHARSSARLVASEGSLAAVHHVVIPIRDMLSSKADAETCYESIRTVVRTARVEFTRAARADLGFEIYREPPDGA